MMYNAHNAIKKNCEICNKRGCKMTEVTEVKEKDCYGRVLLLAKLIDSYYENKKTVKNILKIIKYEKDNFERLNFPFPVKTKTEIEESFEELTDIAKKFIKIKELSSFTRNVRALRIFIENVEDKCKSKNNVVEKITQSGEEIVKKGAESIKSGIEKLKTFATEKVEEVKKNITKKDN